MVGGWAVRETYRHIEEVVMEKVAVIVDIYNSIMEVVTEMVLVAIYNRKEGQEMEKVVVETCSITVVLVMEVKEMGFYSNIAEVETLNRRW